MLKDSYDTLSEETKPRSTNDGLHNGAFKKGTTSECHHRLIQRIKVFTRSSTKDGGTPVDAFKKETAPIDAVAAGLARTRQGLHPAPSTSEVLVEQHYLPPHLAPNSSLFLQGTQSTPPALLSHLVTPAQALTRPHDSISQSSDQTVDGRHPHPRRLQPHQAKIMRQENHEEQEEQCR